MAKNYPLSHLEIETSYPLDVDWALMIIRSSYGDGFYENELLASKDKFLEVMNSVLSSMEPVESYVIRMRFNSQFNERPTLEKIGDQFKISRERVRQIEAKALRKMVHPKRSELIFNLFKPSLIAGLRQEISNGI